MECKNTVVLTDYLMGHQLLIQRAIMGNRFKTISEFFASQSSKEASRVVE